MRWTWSLSTAFVALYAVPYMLSGGIGPYSFIYTAPFFLALLLGSVALSPGRPLLRFDHRGLYFFVLPVIAFVWVTYLRKSTSFYEFNHVLTGAVTVSLMLLFLDRDEQIERMLRALKGVVVVLALWCVAEVLTNPGLEPSATFPRATYSNPNRLASCLTLVSPILWVEAAGLIKTKRTRRWVAGLLLVLVALVTYLTAARLNQLAFLAQGGVVAWQRLKHRRTLGMWLLRGVFVLVIAVVAQSVITRIVFDSPSVSLEGELKNTTGSVLIRLVMIWDGLRLFWESGGLGLGTGNVTYSESSQPAFGAAFGGDTIYPLHNFPLQLAATYGIMGIGLFAYTFFTTFRDVVRTSERADLHLSVAIIRKSAWAFLLSFPLISLSPSYLFSYRPFYFMFGLYLVIGRILTDRSKTPGADTH